MKDIKIFWQKDNPIGLTIKKMACDRKHDTDEEYSIWFQGQNYLYSCEIADFIKALEKAKSMIEFYEGKKIISENVKNYHGLKFRIWLFFHTLKCRFWNWRIPRDLNSLLTKWNSIDRSKDDSWTSHDFRFWLYVEKIKE